MSLAQGAALHGAGRYHEALAALKQALLLDPDSVPVRMQLAQTCAAMGDPHTGMAWLSDACRVGAGDPSPWHTLAGSLLTQKKYAQALAAYRHLYETLGDRDRATLLHYGFCLEHGFELDEAARLYREAIAAEPGFMEAHVDLAGLLWRLQDFEGSLTHAQAAVAIAPDNPFAVRILGTALLYQNRLAEAEQALARALKLQPGMVLAELDMAFVLLLGGRLAEGFRWYRARWRDTDRVSRPSFYSEPYEWKGPALQPVQGKRIAVYAEQGLG